MTSLAIILANDENDGTGSELIVARMSVHVRKFDYPEILKGHLTSIAPRPLAEGDPCMLNFMALFAVPT